MMLVLAYCAGLRIGEIVRLNVGDFNIDDRVIEVRGTKFFKSRRLPLSESAVAALQSYLAARKNAGASMTPDAALFWHQHAGGRYSRDRAGKLLVRVLRRAKLKPDPGRVGPRVHDLRHAFVAGRMLACYCEGTFAHQIWEQKRGRLSAPYRDHAVTGIPLGSERPAYRWQLAAESLNAVEKPAKIGSRAIQRHGFKELEAAGESVLEGVGRPRSELFMGRFSPIAPHFSREVLGRVKFIFDECLEDAKPGLVVRDLDFLPCGNPDLHRLESALCFVDSNGYCVLQQEMFRVLGEDNIEVASKRKVAAHEDPQPHHDREAELLTVAVSDAEGEVCTVHSLVEGHHAEEVLAVLRDGVFLRGDGDMAKPKLFFKGVDDFNMWNHLVGRCRMRGRHKGQVRSGQFAGRVGTGDERRFRHTISPFQGATVSRWTF